MNLNFLSLIAALAAAANLLLGFYVWVNGPRTRLRALFFGMAFLQAVWCFIGVILFSAPDHEAFMTWYRAGSPFYIAYYPLTLHFFLEFTGSIRHRAVLLPVLYLPAVVIVYGFFADPSSIQIIERQGEFWTFTFSTGTWLYCLYMSYFFSCFLGVALLLYRWRRRTGSRREKHQATVMLSALAITLSLGLLEAELLPLFGVYRSLGLAPIVFLVWTSGIARAIVRYNLLSITSAQLSREIVGCIEEPLLLLDLERRVTIANRAAGEALTVPPGLLKGRLFAELVSERDWTDGALSEVLSGGSDRVVGRVRFLNSDHGAAFYDIRISRVTDGFGDLLGVMVLGRRVEGLEALRSRHRITAREMEVLQHMLAGRSNAAIGHTLGLSERTVKTHITSIFNKLGVDSRAQLGYMLKDYPPPHAFPEESAPSVLQHGPRLLIKRHRVE